jgi:hypothetical protein
VIAAGWRREVALEPAILALLALAAVCALSAAWTIGEATIALRWGAVVAGYGLIAVAAGLVAARLGPVAPAALIAVLAAAAGLVGLYGAGARVEPLAQRLGGQWSPGGPLEYSPALGLAQVSALPVLLMGAARSLDPRERRGVVAAALGLAIAGAVLALVGSRVQLAIGAVVVVAVVAVAPRALGAGRPLLAAGAALAIAGGGFADAVAGSYAEPHAEGDDLPRLLGLGAIMALAPALWLAQRSLMARGGSGTAPGLAIVAVAAPVAAALALAAATDDGGPQAEPISGFAHGRPELWEAAIETARDRPLAGAGARSFYEASLVHQDPPAVRFAHNLPLESWAELGIAGALCGLLLYGLSSALVLRASRSPPAEGAAWLLGPAVLAFLVSNLFDWPWHVPAAGALFAIALGGLAGSLRPAPRPSRSGPPSR